MISTPELHRGHREGTEGTERSLSKAIVATAEKPDYSFLLCALCVSSVLSV